MELRICASNNGYGVWDSDNAALDPDALPISAELRTLLGQWMGSFWSQESPMAGERLDQFALDGQMIARAFKAELPNWTIIYYDQAAAARHQDDDGFEKFDADPWQYEVTPWSEWPQIRKSKVTVEQ